MRISILMFIYTIHFTHLKVYTKFENTGCSRSWEIFETFIGEKEKWTNKGTDKQYAGLPLIFHFKIPWLFPDLWPISRLLILAVQRIFVRLKSIIIYKKQHNWSKMIIINNEANKKNVCDSLKWFKF